MAQKSLDETVYSRVQRVIARTDLTEEQILDNVENFRNLPINAVLNYIELRIDKLRGDENAGYELNEIRKDLAMFSSLNVAEVRHAYTAGKQKASENR